MDSSPARKRFPHLFDVLFYTACVLVLGSVVFLAVQNRRLYRSYVALAGRSNKVGMVARAIERWYVDTLDWNVLEDNAIRAMISALDPHTAYLPKKELTAANEALNGNFYGIGVRYQMYRDTAVVIGVVSNGPSDKAGLLPGDRIVAINDSTVAGVHMALDDLPSLLKGPDQSKVRVSVRRPLCDSLIAKTIVRGNIPLPSLDVAYMYDETTGYIKLNKFARTTGMEFLLAVEFLKKQRMGQLILDLRENTGGYFETAIGLLGEFFPKDSLLVYTKGRTQERKEYRGTGHMACKGLKVAVLIDDATASASEIVAGALQDYERGIIIGRRSYGKGLVQEQIPLRDGSALRLTTARYYTPLGRCIQKPYTLGEDETYAQEVQTRYASGEMLQSDSIKQNPELIVYTRQHHKPLYGGGGIVPDLFVPIDTSYYTPYLSRISRRNLLSVFAFEYADSHRAELGVHPSWQALYDALKAGPTWDAFLAYAAGEGIRGSEADLRISGEYLRTVLFASVARHIQGDNGFFPIWNLNDNMVTTAAETLHQNSILENQQ